MIEHKILHHDVSALESLITMIIKVEGGNPNLRAAHAGPGAREHKEKNQHRDLQPKASDVANAEAPGVGLLFPNSLLTFKFDLVLLSNLKSGEKPFAS